MNKKLNERWFVVCKELKAIHDGFSIKQAKAKHKISGGSGDYIIYRVVSELAFTPKGRKPRDNEASFRIVGGKLVTAKCSLEIVHEQN